MPSEINHMQVRKILGKSSGAEAASGLLGAGGSSIFFSVGSYRPFSPRCHLGKENEVGHDLEEDGVAP